MTIMECHNVLQGCCRFSNTAKPIEIDLINDASIYIDVDKYSI